MHSLRAPAEKTGRAVAQHIIVATNTCTLVSREAVQLGRVNVVLVARISPARIYGSTSYNANHLEQIPTIAGDG